MKKCDCCGTPLSDFEVKFHSEAGSPAAISEKCWTCSRANEAFSGADVENKGDKKQIFYCAAGLLAIFVAFLPLLPFLDEYELPLLMSLYSTLAVIFCIAVGAFVSHPILTRFFSRSKESRLRIDPPEQRYGTRYSPVTTHYEGRERFDGTFIVNKVTRGGAEQVDRWEWHSTNNQKIDGILGMYDSLLQKIIYITALLFLGISFVFWAIPYIAYKVLKNKLALEKRAKIPAALQKAYRTSLAAAKPMPLTYHDKVGFLVSRENCQKKPKHSEGDAFLSNFKETEKRDVCLPFFFKRYDGVAYMIVDYKEGSRVGTTFVLVKEKNGPIEKRIVVGKSFAQGDPDAWEADWSALSSKARYNVAWYEEKFMELLKKPYKEIVG